MIAITHSHFGGRPKRLPTENCGNENLILNVRSTFIYYLNGQTGVFKVPENFAKSILKGYEGGIKFLHEIDDTCYYQHQLILDAV